MRRRTIAVIFPLGPAVVLLVAASRLLAGGSTGRIVALDKGTGARIWANTEIPDGAAYCSPLIVTHNGIRQLITVMMSLVEANPQRARIASQFGIPRRNRGSCLAHPVVCGGRLYVRHWNDLLAYAVSASPSR